MITWPDGVNQIIQNEVTWGPTDGLKRETMRSGKDKTSLKSSSVPDVFNVSMLFTRAEYNVFLNWFKLSLRRGNLSFVFPRIAGTGTAEYKTTTPAFSNPGGDIVKCTMTWSEQ